MAPRVSLLAKFKIPDGPPKPVVKRQKKDHETHAEHRRMEALDAERKRFQKYLDLRATRLVKLRKAHPSADRYVKVLDRIASDTVAYSRRDCDQDLADVAERLKLRDIPDPYSRFLLVEYTLAWIGDLAKAQRTYKFDDADIFGGERGTIDDLKSALGVH